MLKRICDHPGLLSENTMEELQDGLEGEIEKDQVDRVLANAVLSMASDEGFKTDPMTSCKLRFLKFFLVGASTGDEREGDWRGENYWLLAGYWL